MSNIRIYFKGDGPKDSINRVVPEYEKDYPEPGRWKIMPSYGFFFRHIKNLKLHDVQISFMKNDPRPPFIFDDVKAAILYDIRAQKSADASYFMLKNVQDIDIQKVRGVKDVNIKNVDRRIL